MSIRERIRVAVVDDHPMLREGVSKTLASDDALEMVGEGSSAGDALRIARDLLPDVMLLDVSMPGGGITAVREVTAACPIVHLGMLTVSENDDDVLESLKAGARAYILKGISGSELIDIVKILHRGEMYVSPSLAARVISESVTSVAASARGPATASVNDLTPREEQILALLAEGMSNREIGERLRISEKTVKNYVTNLFQKLQVRNRVEAAMLARQQAGERID